MSARWKLPPRRSYAASKRCSIFRNGFGAQGDSFKPVMRRLTARSEVQYFCHPTELYKSFVKFDYAHVATEEYGISWKLSEMMCYMVAVHNTCTL